MCGLTYYLDGVANSTHSQASIRPKIAWPTTFGSKRKNGKIVIEDTKLQLTLLVLAHTSPHGSHYPADLMIMELDQLYTWPTIRQDAHLFSSKCLHCLSDRLPKHIRRPIGEQMHGHFPNEVLHWDYLFIQNDEWVLIIRDDFTGLIRLYYCEHSPDSEHAAQCLLDWFSIFGICKVLVSDGASYFKAGVINTLAEKLSITKHITTPHLHYSNGTVEVLCKLVQKALRVSLSQTRMDKSSWPTLLPQVQHFLNHKPQRRLNNRAPIEVMTGLPRDSVFAYLQPTFSSRTVQDHLADVEEYLPILHKEINQMTDRQRALHRRYRSKSTQPIQFQQGDFVLIARTPTKIKTKLYLTWTGPFQVLRPVSTHVFEVQDIVTDKCFEIHVVELRSQSGCSISDNTIT
jgi:hypothetical protein